MAAAMQIFMSQEKGTSRPNKITPKQIKFEDEEDRISLLPDCLLIEILSRFDETKEAIKTSTLSKRWQHLWTQVPNLIFHQKYPHSTTKFFSIVDKTLTQCSRQSTLNRFILSADYDIQFEDLLNNWIHYAIHRNVQEMDLSLAMARVPPFVLDQLIFTKSCFTRLNFRRCRLSPTSAVDWKNLKSLYISRVKLNEDLIQNILSGSPILETFELCYCEGFRRLDITSKVVKNLVCHGYYRDPECIDPKNVIEINAPYITSLTIRGMLMLRNLVLLNLTSLIKANFNFWKRSDMESEEEEMLSRFVLNLRHVKELKIGDFCLEILSRLEAKGFTSPSNVNYL